MRVVWTGTFEPGFSRNRKLARLIALVGAEVRVVRETVWGEDRIGLAAGRKIPTLLRAAVRYPRLLVRLLISSAPDAYLVSYPGWFDVPLVCLVARLKRRPVLFDPFISLYDTMIGDRRLHPEGSLPARMAAWIDRLSLRLADHVVADTHAHLALYDEMAPGSASKGTVIPLGADDDVFRPVAGVAVDERLVAFHGTFVPLQSVETVVEAGALLANRGVRTLIIGDGQDRPAVEAALLRTHTDAIELVGLLPLEEVARRIATAAVCLGIFGSSDKAGRVVPHKVYECIASGRPVVTRASSAIEGLFEEGEIVTVPPRDAVRLAAAVMELLDDDARRQAIADAGLEAYRSRFHESALAQSLRVALDHTVASNMRSPRS